MRYTETQVEDHLHLPFASAAIWEYSLHAANASLLRYLDRNRPHLDKLEPVEKSIELKLADGMLTHGQSDFYIQYIDPDSHAIRSYYPDFLLQKEDGSYVIIEVKGDHQVDDPVVQAKKEFAQQTAVASGMTYEIIKGTDATAHRYHSLFTPTPRSHQPRIPPDRGYHA